MLQPFSTFPRTLAEVKPGFVPPLIPTLVSHPPAGDGWLHEIKHDGYRTIIAVEDGSAVGFTRNGHNWTDRYRRICDAAARLTCRSAVLDGEMVVQGENGVSDFQALRVDIANGGHRLFLYAFDLLHLDGRDLRSAPLIERRGLSRDLIRGDECSPIQFSKPSKEVVPNCSPLPIAWGSKASYPSGPPAATEAGVRATGSRPNASW